MKLSLTKEDANHIFQKDGVDLFALIGLVWGKKWFLARVSLLFLLFGVVLTLTTRKEYSSISKLMPESQDKSGGKLSGLSGLAGLAGISLGAESSEGIPTKLYPEVISSKTFLLKLVNRPIYFGYLKEQYSTYVYFDELLTPTVWEILYDYSFGLPGKVISVFAKPDSDQSTTSHRNETPALSLSKKEIAILNELEDRLIIIIDDETGIITVGARMPDPIASAELCNVLIQDLKERVTDYRIEKAKSNLMFIEKSVEEARSAYETAQNNLAVFADRNVTISTAKAQIQLTKLENEVNLTFDVYRGLANELEQAKIQLNKEIPLFTTLQPIIIPVSHSEPNGKLIILLCAVLGLFLATALIIFKLVWLNAMT